MNPITALALVLWAFTCSISFFKFLYCLEIQQFWLAAVWAGIASTFVVFIATYWHRERRLHRESVSRDIASKLNGSSNFDAGEQQQEKT